MKIIMAASSFGLLASIVATQSLAQQVQGPTTAIAVPGTPAGGGIDFAHAKAMPLPAANIPPPSPATAYQPAPSLQQVFGPPGVSVGAPGDGKQNPVILVPPRDILEPQGAIPQGAAPQGAIPQEFGTSGQPNTTSMATAFPKNTVLNYPFRAAGKLFFNIGGSTFICSASLIKKGLVVTAAHCVANFGKSQFYSNWHFDPGYTNGVAPYGDWTAAQVRVLTSYLNGTDPCAQSGVICQDDVAVIALNSQDGAYPGPQTGWLAYGWNGYSYNSSRQALITQLGYPKLLDGGALQERTDSQGFTASSFSNNTIIGSLQTGGSSGGPWVVNLGLAPTLAGVSFGTAATHEVVVGVTSWGYNGDPAIKQQGASPFTNGNIKNLVNAQCAATPAAC